MSPEEAFASARDLKLRQPNVSKYKLDEFAQVVVRSGNIGLAYRWTKNIGFHRDEMLQVALDFGSAPELAKWAFDLALQPTFAEQLLIKQRIVELEQVSLFVGTTNKLYIKGYSFDDFYEDLPTETRVGINL